MSTTAYIIGFLSALVIVLCLGFFFLFLNQLRRKDDPPGHAQSDLTNMMILFQTMRDVVSEQKTLAREFNASLDRKVDAIRGQVSAAREEREELRQSLQAISKLLVQAKDEFAAGESAGAPAQSETAAELDAIGADLERVEESPESEPPLLAMESEENASDPVDDLIDSWTSADFAGPESISAPDLPPVETPTAPEDAAAARDAFRTLLDIDSESSQEAAPVTDSSPGPRTHAGIGNGKPRLSPLQRRVYEYSDAGMKVSDIAKELGIGKGEIRLIQSLRGDKERL